MKNLKRLVFTILCAIGLSFSIQAQNAPLEVTNESACEVIVQASAFNCTDHCLTAIYCIPPHSTQSIAPCGAFGKHYEWVWAGVGESSGCVSCEPQFMIDLASPFAACAGSGPYQITGDPCSGDCDGFTAEFVGPNHLVIY
jgi:hypothetical protein